MELNNEQREELAALIDKEITELQAFIPHDSRIQVLISKEIKQWNMIKAVVESYQGSANW